MVNELGLLWVLYLSDRRACTCAMLSPMVIPPFETFGTITLVKFITTSISEHSLMPCLQKLGYRQFYRILQNLLGLRVLGLPHSGRLSSSWVGGRLRPDGSPGHPCFRVLSS